MSNSLLEVLRTEEKYPMNYGEFLLLRSKLKTVLHEDEHNGYEGYRVRSLYFDTLEECIYEIPEHVYAQSAKHGDMVANLYTKVAPTAVDVIYQNEEIGR